MLLVDDIKNFVASEFPQFGVNKQYEVARLLLEIARREACDFKTILTVERKDNPDYTRIKEQLLKRRYPRTFDHVKKSRFSLQALNIFIEHKKDLNRPFRELPRTFYVEKAVAGTNLVRELKKKYPNIPHKTIESYKDYNKFYPFTINDYNTRMDKMFIIKEKFDFLIGCPCTNKRKSCGYHILNVGTGCGFECSYCFLQSYSNSHGVTIPANLEDFFAVLDKINQKMRIGTGQFTDSLIFDYITNYSKKLIEYFRAKPHLSLEFKTKSNFIKNIISTKPADNIIVSWSINPQKMIEEVEFYTPGIEERFHAAQLCQDAGYHIGFHFDPIIYHSRWESEYKYLVDRIFDNFHSDSLSLISLGCLRMTPRQKQVIENRFPQTTILNEELILGFDNKLRYPFPVRVEIYQKMVSWIREHDKNVKVYLCMESPQMYKQISGDISYVF